MKFLFHAIVCHVLVGDTGEKRVAEKIAKCCIRERKKGVGGGQELQFKSYILFE